MSHTMPNRKSRRPSVKPSCMVVWAIMVCLATLLGPGSARADAKDQSLKIRLDIPAYDLAPRMGVLEDPAEGLTLNDLSDKKFQDQPSRTLNFGVTASAFWLKFTLYGGWDENRSSSQTRVLDLGEAFPGRIRWSLYDGQSGKLIGSGGARTTRGNYAKIQVSSKPRTFYLRVSSTTGFMMYPRLFTWDAYIDHKTHHHAWFGAFYGIIVAVAIYNLLLFFSFNDRSYLWYVLHLIFALLYFAGINGISGKYIFPQDPEFFGALNRSFLGMMIAFMALLTKSFLLTRIKAPRTDRMIVAVFIFACALALANLLFPARITVTLLILNGILVPLMIITAAWNSLKGGFQPARLFMAAWAFFVIGIVLFGATSGGMIPYNLICFHWFQISSAVAAILLSLALANRIKTLREKHASLENNMKRMKMILDSMESGVFLIESKTRKIVELNQSAEKLIGRNREEIIGKFCWQFIRSTGSEACPMMDQCKSGECRDDKLIHKTGDEIPVLKRAKLIELDGHSLILESFVDISDLRKAQEAVNRSEAKFRALFESSRDAVMILDQDRYVECNQAALGIFGCNSVDELIGRTPADFSPPFQPSGADSRAEACRQMEKAFSGGSAFFEWRHSRLNGDAFPAEIMLSKVDVQGKIMLQALARDITTRKTMENELKRLASTDPLTGADNRRSFLEKGERELLRARRYHHPFSVLMMDIDHFKSVNDTHGHQVGDEVLKTLVSQSNRLIRATDILGRLGGEEFAVILPETTAGTALEVCERLRVELSEIVVDSDRGPVRFTVSIGLSMCENASDTLAAIMERADAALYRAKAGGRNRVVRSDEANEMI